MLPSKGIVGPSDPYFANVNLLLHGDGANQGTVITDSGPFTRTMTVGGGAHTSTTQFQWGTASLNVNPITTNYGWIVNDDVGNVSNGTWTVEFWIRPATLSGYICEFGKRSTNQVQITLNGSSGRLKIYLQQGANTINYVVATPLTTGVWTHVAITSISGVTRMFVNGVNSGGGTFGTSWLLDVGTTIMSSYANRNTSSSDKLNGYIDDFRVTGGVCRYVSNFTVPTAAYPNQ